MAEHHKRIFETVVFVPFYVLVVFRLTDIHCTIIAAQHLVEELRIHSRQRILQPEIVVGLEEVANLAVAYIFRCLVDERTAKVYTTHAQYRTHKLDVLDAKVHHFLLRNKRVDNII